MNRIEHAPTESQAIRQRIRRGEITGHTSGLAPGCVQGNVVILPADLASDFLRFCQANPKPCPLLAVSEPGDPSLPSLGRDIDMRSDVPRYRVFRNGAMVEEPTDIGHLWRNDLVSFVIGCSFSFEWALLEDGLRLRHQDSGVNVPMYRTSIQTVAAGRFHELTSEEQNLAGYWSFTKDFRDSSPNPNDLTGQNVTFSLDSPPLAGVLLDASAQAGQRSLLATLLATTSSAISWIAEMAWGLWR